MTNDKLNKFIEDKWKNYIRSTDMMMSRILSLQVYMSFYKSFIIIILMLII